MFIFEEHGRTLTEHRKMFNQMFIMYLFEFKSLHVEVLLQNAEVAILYNLHPILALHDLNINQNRR